MPSDSARAGARGTACLLLLAACGGEVPPRASPAPWFEEVGAASGLAQVWRSGAQGRLEMPEIMGGGAALFDADGDGDLDIALTAAGRDGTGDARLFRQEAGGRFVDVTAEAGLGSPGYGMGLAVGDVDNDGDPDLYVTRYGEDRLYRNGGDGTFEADPAATERPIDGWSSSATFCDYDGDGFLDLFVTRYVEYDPSKPCFDGAGRPEYCSPQAFPPTPDVLLRNRGDGSFEDVSEASGIAAGPGPGLGVVCEDLNADGRPDFYVANDGAANRLWINDGDGRFRDRALMLGVAYNLEGRAEAGMGVVAADLDGDGALDLFLTHLASESHTLYGNRGGARGFLDRTGTSGLAAGTLVVTGFGTAAVDLELDGDLDLLVANGRVKRDAEAAASGAGPFAAYAERNQIFRQVEPGRFEAGDAEGSEFTLPSEVSRGLAVGDIDDDGDLDVLVANIESGARLYRNVVPRLGGALRVRAIDPRLGRPAIGARVTLETARGRQLRTITRGFSYLSSSEPVAHFGLAAGDRPQALLVRWPDGMLERFAASEADGATVLLLRGSGEVAP